MQLVHGMSILCRDSGERERGRMGEREEVEGNEWEEKAEIRYENKRQPCGYR